MAKLSNKLLPKTGSGKLLGGALPQNASGSPELPYRIRTTHPDELLRHNISDEELDLLDSNRHDSFREAGWAFGMAGVGALFSVGKNVHDAFWAIPAQPMSGWGIFELIVCMLCLGLGAAFGFVAINNSKRAAGLAKKIRERTNSQSSGGVST